MFWFLKSRLAPWRVKIFVDCLRPKEFSGLGAKWAFILMSYFALTWGIQPLLGFLFKLKKYHDQTQVYFRHAGNKGPTWFWSRYFFLISEAIFWPNMIKIENFAIFWRNFPDLDWPEGGWSIQPEQSMNYLTLPWPDSNQGSAHQTILSEIHIFGND